MLSSMSPTIVEDAQGRARARGRCRGRPADHHRGVADDLERDRLRHAGRARGRASRAIHQQHLPDELAIEDPTRSTSSHRRQAARHGLRAPRRQLRAREFGTANAIVRTKDGWDGAPIHVGAAQRSAIERASITGPMPGSGERDPPTTGITVYPRSYRSPKGQRKRDSEPAMSRGKPGSNKKLLHRAAGARRRGDRRRLRRCARADHRSADRRGSRTRPPSAAKATDVQKARARRAETQARKIELDKIDLEEAARGGEARPRSAARRQGGRDADEGEGAVRHRRRSSRPRSTRSIGLGLRRWRRDHASSWSTRCCSRSLEDQLTESRQDGARPRSRVALKEIPDKQIWVQGHTDDQPIGRLPPPKAPPPKRGQKPVEPPPGPKFATNWELSAARALTVVHYLQDVAKVDPSRLAALAFGQYRPVSKVNKAANRRIEIVLYPKPIVKK